MSTLAGDSLSRADLLKLLREQHADSIARTQTYYKELRSIQTKIWNLIRDTPKTVPEVASALDIPTQDVLWHLTAMKKYGIVVESGMSGDYPLYQKVEEQ
jgi:predicted transcriptional regulator